MRPCSKVVHLTIGSAEYHADQLEAVNGTRPDIYSCAGCGFYHVGYSNSKRQKMNRKGRRSYKSAKGKKRNKQKRNQNGREKAR